jgi:pimeloyl-ACP methyl ester carboxylesterase
MMVPVAQSRDLARRIPHARVAELPGEGHLLIIDHLSDVLDGLLRGLIEG